MTFKKLRKNNKFDGDYNFDDINYNKYTLSKKIQKLGSYKFDLLLTLIRIYYILEYITQNTYHYYQINNALFQPLLFFLILKNFKVIFNVEYEGIKAYLSGYFLIKY